MYNAGYSPELQHRDLKFFAQVVAPSLGVSRGIMASTGDVSPWPSFMTDDGTPIEMSWDWGTKDGPPVIRYSIESIGLDAGTALDPNKLRAGPVFQERLTHALPQINLEWFHHFEEFLGVSNCGDASLLDGHKSYIFYAFDLSSTGTTAKVYFFPKF